MVIPPPATIVPLQSLPVLWASKVRIKIFQELEPLNTSIQPIEPVQKERDFPSS